MSDSEHNEPIISMKKLMKLTAKQLKAKLQEKGLAHSAKNKELLAKRLYRLLNSFQSDSASDVDSDNSYEEVHLPSADELQNWLQLKLNIFHFHFLNETFLIITLFINTQQQDLALISPICLPNLCAAH